MRTAEWSGYPDPTDPDNFWIDDETGERVNARTGERTVAPCDDLPHPTPRPAALCFANASKGTPSDD